MSLFQHERLYISIEPHRIALVKVAGMRSPRMVESTLVNCNIDTNDHTDSLRDLKIVLNKAPWRGSKVEFILSDLFTHYFIVILPRDIRGYEELNALIKAQFEGRYDLSAEDWQFSANLQPFASRILVCAVKKSFIETINTLCADCEMTIKSIQPFLISEFNKWHTKIDGRNSLWFTSVESCCVTIGLIKDNQWSHIQTINRNEDNHYSLWQTIERDRLIENVFEPSLRVFCTGQPIKSLNALPAEYKIDMPSKDCWPGQTDTWSNEYRLALSRVWP